MKFQDVLIMGENKFNSDELVNQIINLHLYCYVINKLILK